MERTKLPRRLASALAASLAAALVVAAAVWALALDRALSEAEDASLAQLSFASEGLGKDLVRYKIQSKTLAETFDPDASAADRLELAQRAAGISGAEQVWFLTDPDRTAPELGRAVNRALQGAIGFDYIGGAFVVAAPIRRASAFQGAVAISIQAAELEWAWRALPEVLFFAGDGGKIRVASQPGLRGRALNDGADPLPTYRAETTMGRTTWRLGDDWRALGVAFQRALLVSRPAPVLDMTAYMLVDVAPAYAAAWTAAAAAGASVFALCLFALVILQRRHALRQRLQLEARANQTLEATVQRRTAALTAEIAERRTAEAALRDAQDDLVQAGKMSALGHMAAGIAHELNQPLTAIRGFADNARILMDRGRGAEADENLGRISDLTARAGRIIKNLRAFARNEPEPGGPVPLNAVIDDALALVAARMRMEGADIRLVRPDTPLIVVGGVVRLQQVLVNLLSNALDAMADAPGVIEVTADETDDLVSVTIRDHGPGLSDDVIGRVFDPFFTTKMTGGEGMGLGLSISYGIMRSFGGDLRAANHPDGGAMFTLDLKRAPAQEAAA